MSNQIGSEEGAAPDQPFVDLNRVDLNLLVAFEALMSERSVTGAAERLAIGQAAMSSTLGRIRKLFNDPILVRQGRAMITTPLANAIADTVSADELNANYIIPSVFHPDVHQRVAAAVRRVSAAQATD